MRVVQLVKLSVVVIIVGIVALSAYGNIQGQTATPTATQGTAAATPTTGATGSPSPQATGTPGATTVAPPTSTAPPPPQATTVPTTAAPTKPAATVAPPAPASAQCTPSEVTVFARSARIEVKCAKATANGISFFDLPTTDPNLTQRALTLLMTAVTDKKALRITYDDNDTSGQAFGCSNKDCRVITEITLIS